MITVSDHCGGPDPIAATLALAEAATIHWDAIVIGAGPAGSAVAIRLARQGRRVLQVDRAALPRPKVCGCCLSPLAVAELVDLGTGRVLAAALPLATVRLLASGREARIPMPRGNVLSREALDTELVREAILAGSAWLPQVVVESIHESAETIPENGGVLLTARSSVSEPQETARLRSRLVVIAAGLADAIGITSAKNNASAQMRLPRGRRVASRSRIGLGTTLPAGALDLPPGELIMAVAHDGYCGIVTLEDGRIDFAAAVDRRLIAGADGLAGCITQLLSEADGGGGSALDCSQLSPLLKAVSFRATPPLTHASPLLGSHSERIFRVGDAAGYVEPFTGEGIGWALASGRILAASLTGDRGAPLIASAAAAAGYQVQHRRMFTAHHGRVSWVAHGVRHPTIVTAAVQLANLMPWAAARALPLVTGAGRAAASRAGISPGQASAQ